MLAPSLVKRLTGCRFQPPVENAVTRPYERLRNPAQVGILGEPVNACLDVSGRELGHSHPHPQRLYRLPRWAYIPGFAAAHRHIPEDGSSAAVPTRLLRTCLLNRSSASAPSPR